MYMLKSIAITIICIALMSSPVVADNCGIPSKQCLIQANKNLAGTAKNSLSWYKYTLQKLESLIAIKDFAQARSVIESLEPNSGPPYFQSFVTMFTAKVLIVEARKPEAIELVKSAKLDLEEFNNAFFSPMRSIYIANLMLDLALVDQAVEILLDLKQNHAHNQDPILNLELYGNLGHAYRTLNQHEQSKQYYLTSLKHAKALNNNQQIMTLYAHVGHAHLYLNEIAQAEKMLKSALYYAQLDNQDISIANARLYLASFYIKQQVTDLARQQLEQIPDISLLPYQQNLKSEIVQALQAQSH